jgi:hypothetical protein
MIKGTEILLSGDEECINCGGKNLKTNKLMVECIDCNTEYPNYDDLSISNKERDNYIFGYGSLMLPNSLISRFIEFDIETSSIYSKEGRIQSYIRGEGLMEIEKFDIEIIPAKIRNYNRTYCMNSKRGGKMLGCSYSGKESDFINGFIIGGLNRNQIESITQTESGYELRKVGLDKFEFYNKNDIESDKEVEIYVSKENKDGDYKSRNRIYHNRILAGILMLEEIYDREVMEKFYEDFVSSFK